MSRICVIGGSGFIGSYLLQLISKNYTIINIDIKKQKDSTEVEYIQADIRDYDKLRKVFPANIDLVVLLAAAHSDDVSPVSTYYDVNVKGTDNVLKAMTETNCNSIIFTSSVAVYGLNKSNPDEFSPTNPFNHYGKSKLEAEKVLKKWYDREPGEKSVTIIRPTVIFGPGNRGNVYNLLCQISSGKFMMIGNGNNRKSMAYVENIAGFMAHCIDSKFKNFHLFNYIDKPDFSTRELVSQAEFFIGKKILAVKIPCWLGFSLATMLDVLYGFLGKKNPISAVRVKKFCATTQFDSKAIQATGYKPPFDLKKGLEITIKSIIEERKMQIEKN
jgi:nucleoside-diphosphate-sugar epimerase